MRRRFGLAAVSVVLALVASACGRSSGSSDASTTTKAAGGAQGAITVSAAASLTEAFGEIGTAFSEVNPDASVSFNFGSSGTLATQLQQGAPADVFASADEANMDQLVTSGLVEGRPEVFARNELVIVTKPGNPSRVRSLADLATLDVVALCGAEVPCGKYAAQVLRNADVTIPEAKITRGQDVKATLGAVTNGDAQAAIVYVTDAETAGTSVHSVAIPDAQNAVATYPIAVLGAAPNAATARAFVRFVTSPSAEVVLKSFGYLPPS
jgi:molybdate transport system substrate-binding protein